MGIRTLACFALLPGLVVAGCKAGVVLPTARASRGPVAIAPATVASPDAGGLVAKSGGNVISNHGGGVISNNTGNFTGTVLGLDGQPAAGVPVRAYIIANNGGGLISDQGGSLVSNNSGNIISDRGSGVVANNGGSYALLDAAATSSAAPALETTTDASGHFALTAPAKAALTLEAVKAPNVKAIKLGVPAGAGDLLLQLAYTGDITGRVTAPGVTDLEGADVYVPGTSYVAKTRADGTFTLSEVPIGAFELAADDGTLGSAHQHDVTVRSNETTHVPDLALAVDAPSLASLDPPNGAVGRAVKISGANFGKRQGKTLSVTFNGSIATDATASDDGTITATVPVGATSGNVVVTVGGIASNALPFQVIDKFDLFPAVATLGKNRAQHFTVVATDPAGNPVPDPVLDWTTPDAILQVTPGQVLPTGVGEASFKVGSGTKVKEVHVTVADGYGQVSTLAGDGTSGFKDGPAAGARFNGPVGVAVGPDGAIYVADAGNHRIRKIDRSQPDAPVVSTVVGATGGWADGPAASARFDDPQWIAVDAAGNLYVTEYATARVREIVMANGVADHVVTLAGTGQPGYVDGAGSVAQFKGPKGIALDAAGAIYVADSDNNCVRKLVVGPDGQVTVTTVAGSTDCADVDGAGKDARLCGPAGLAFDPHAGTLVVADLWHDKLRRVTPAGETSSVGATPVAPMPAASPFGLFHPNGAAAGADGTLYITEPNDGTNQVRRLGPDGKLSVLAGVRDGGYADGYGPDARFAYPAALAVDAHGHVIVVDRANNRIREIAP